MIMDGVDELSPFLFTGRLKFVVDGGGGWGYTQSMILDGFDQSPLPFFHGITMV